MTQHLTTFVLSQDTISKHGDQTNASSSSTRLLVSLTGHQCQQLWLDLEAFTRVWLLTCLNGLKWERCWEQHSRWGGGSCALGQSPEPQGNRTHCPPHGNRTGRSFLNYSALTHLYPLNHFTGHSITARVHWNVIHEFNAFINPCQH